MNRYTLKICLSGILLFLLILFSCSEEKTNIKKEKPEIDYLTKVVLTDTFSNVLNEASASRVTMAKYLPIYLGPIQDSLFLDYNPNKFTFRTFESDFKRADTNDLKIFIDTTRIIPSAILAIPFPPPPPGMKIEDIKYPPPRYFENIKSYPVFLQNISNDTIEASHGEFIVLILEAVDCLGIWHPIQVRHKYGCGTGLEYFYLPPKNILMTTCNVFKGTYRTKMRMVYSGTHSIYSNEFWGNINYNQFENPDEPEEMLNLF